ncbi:hypothetical protein TEA_015566 [Camellia sinensis var. sinensis]|uniref:Digalactosyldiacylglycerol synthase n=1 Tax=Camellia sinensis var. sinensis TaxID=542762 RepID=A0A4S4CXU2_CAMSN|nr:hypothetical protein TEA_015566 [Camellia sinensis var. sinensis]
MEKKQQISIFTTASLPWMTGTAINPLFRAAYLASHDEERKVTLVLPWLSLQDQEHVYPDNITFNLPSEQEIYVRRWLEERTGFPSTPFNIRFYPGKRSPITAVVIFLPSPITPPYPFTATASASASASATQALSLPRHPAFIATPPLSHYPPLLLQQHPLPSSTVAAPSLPPSHYLQNPSH